MYDGVICHTLFFLYGENRIMANHPLIKDVKKWILDSFSFMDAIGYDVVFDDEEIKNTNIIVADIDGLTDSDFEKGKKNLLKSISNKIKAEFPYLRIRSSKDGDYFIMYIVLADNNDYFKTKNIPYINLNESKESTRKLIKESSTRCVTFEQIVDSRFDDISKGEKILNDRKDEIIELCGDDFSIYTNKIEFLDWGDDESQYRQKYYIRKNNNNVSWNDLYKIVNSVKAVPYKFDKINDSVFESRKSIKESINGDCYIYYNDDDNKRLVFCDYVKGITDTRNWFYLNEYIIDAIHIFKNEKQAQKFIDEHLKYFADQDKVVIAEYPQTVSGFFESKKSARKSIKESDDNWYKLKVLNEMLDAMAKDEYNIPTVGIYGVTKNIDLDEGAIRALIKYYK